MRLVRQHKIPNSWVACMKAWVGEPDWVCSGCSDQTVLTVAGHGLYVGSGWFDARVVEEVEEEVEVEVVEEVEEVEEVE